MTIESLLALIGIGLGGIGTCIYGVHTWKRKNKPRIVSWVAWAITNTVFAWLAYSHDAYWAASFSAIAALLNYSVLIICIVKRHVEYRRSDIFCLVAVFACLALVAVSVDDFAVAWAGIIANLIATAPTFHNAWKHFRHEGWHLFGANALANLLGVFSAGSFDDFAKVAGPLVGMSGNIALTLILVYRKWENKYHISSVIALLHFTNQSNFLSQNNFSIAE